MDCSMPGLPVHHQLLEFSQTHVHELVMPSNHLILCHPLLLLPSIFPSIRAFSNESALRMRCPKYWSFSFSISPSNEHPGMISFRIDWLDLLAVQGTLKSLLQHHSSVLRCSAFFLVQLTHLYMTTGKTIALTRQTFADKVISLLFNMLSRLVITFLPRSKRLLISWPYPITCHYCKPLETFTLFNSTFMHLFFQLCKKYIVCIYYLPVGFPNDSVGKESTCNAGDTGDMGSIPGLG